MSLGRKIVWVLTAIALLGLAGVYLTSWYIALRAPLSVEYEGPCLWAAVNLAHGANIYSAERLVSPPWQATIYTPLFFLLASPFQLLGSYNYWGLRLISFVAFALSMYYAYRLFLLYCQDRLAITIALLSYASYVATWAWSWKGRVDMLSVALTIGCLYALEVAVRSSSEITADREAAGVSKAGAFKRLAPYSLSIALLVAAVYSKQSCLVILPVVCIFLLARRRYIDAIYYGVVCTIACLIIALALQAITGGGFMLHMDVAKKTQGTANLLKHLELFGVDWLKIWFVPVLAVFWGLSKNRQGKSLAHLLLPLLLAAVGTASIIFTIGTKYANINHAIPFFFALSWLLAIFLEARPCLGGLLFILLSGLSTYIISTCLPQKFYVLEKMDKTLEQLHDLKVRGETIFVEDPSLGIASGATPLFVDVATFIMVWENEHQTKQLSEIEAAIQKREYPVVIINENDSLEHQPFYYWNDAFMRQLNENYEKGSPVAANGEVQIMYIPRSSVHPKESFIAPSKSSSQPGK